MNKIKIKKILIVRGLPMINTPIQYAATKINDIY